MQGVHWIKLTTSMFDDEKIKVIETMPDCDTLLIIWIKLLTLAGRVNRGGLICLTDTIPYTAEELAGTFNRPLNTVKLALTLFERYNMIEQTDDGIYICNWEKHQNIEGMERIRLQGSQRIKRFRQQKLLEAELYKGTIQDGIGKCSYCDTTTQLTIDHIIPLSNGGLDIPENRLLCCLRCNQSKNNRSLAVFLNELNNYNAVNIQAVVKNKRIMSFVAYKDGLFTQTVTSCYSNTNVTLQNKIQNKKENKNKEIDSSSSSNGQKNIFEFFENEIGKLTATSTESLKDLIDEYSEGEVIEAIKIAVKSNNRRLNYIEGILENRRNKIPPKTKKPDPASPAKDMTDPNRFKGQMYDGLVQR